MDMDYDELVALVFSVILLFCVGLAIVVGSWSVLEYIHESGAVLLFGVFVGLFFWLLISLTGWDIPILQPSLFSELFYVIMLPPIIFNAGFTMKKRNFFLNVGSIITFAVLGCLISTAVLGGFTFLFGYEGWVPGSDNLIECMLFGSLMSATDPVATLALFMELNVDPLLYSLVFGESVLNDAIAIVLFRTLDNFSATSTALTWNTLWYISRDFIGIAFGSVGIGVGISMLSAFVLARLKRLKLSPTFEITIMILSAYIPYLCAELLELSGILSLFVTGIIMSHYHWYSLQLRSRVSLFSLVGALAYVAETVVFLSVGLTLFERDNPFNREDWKPAFIFSSLFFCFMSRAVNIFPLAALLNLGRKRPIPFKHQFLLWFSGLRGAIALILSLNLKTLHAKLLINTTYIIVLFTNLVIGIVTKPLLKLMKIQMGGEEKLNIRDPDEGSTGYPTMPSEETPILESVTRSTSFEVAQGGKEVVVTRSALHRAWRFLDERVMKPLFGGQPRSSRRSDQSRVSYRSSRRDSRRPLMDDIFADNIFLS